LPDYASYVVVATLMLGLLLAERLWPASASQKGEWTTNAWAFALTSAGHVLMVALLAVQETALVNALGGGLVDLRLLPWWAGAVLYLVVMDLGEYLFHRAQHAIPCLWAMHSLHHSDTALNVTSTQRHFWLEPAIKSVTIWLVVSLLFRADALILMTYFFATLANFLFHANLRLGLGRVSWLVNSPQYHRLHHSIEPAHDGVNYAALLPIFDVLSGVYRRPLAKEYPATGLAAPNAKPLEMLVWPARQVLRREAKLVRP